MNRYFIAFFMIVGIGDFFYGIFFKDLISVLVGVTMVILTAYGARKHKKDETVPGQNNNCGKGKTP